VKASAVPGSRFGRYGNVGHTRLPNCGFGHYPNAIPPQNWRKAQVSSSQGQVWRGQRTFSKDSRDSRNHRFLEKATLSQAARLAQ
jgi:hypothetical protein